MKNTKRLFSALAAFGSFPIICACLLYAGINLTGCSTIGGGGFDAAQQDALITVAASTGTTITLMANPSYRPAFQAASAALGVLSQTNQLTTADILTALQGVNVNGVNTPVVAESIGNVLTLINAFGANVSTLPSTNQLAAVQGVALAAKTGIDQGLSGSGIVIVSTNAPTTP